uniref:Uncharacterized protein n=1 Tax=Timema monikensis TaxID=170555 RepID=A0A7R9EBY2_9NEOP|nr:unnamed protein product [Timema monikensis]
MTDISGRSAGQPTNTLYMQLCLLPWEPKSIPDKLDTASQVELPVFWNEEGRYLAASLGEPLMKGLTEVANTRPKDPIAFLAAYLYNYANKNKSRSGTQESALLITSEQGDGERNMSVPLLAHTEGMDPLQPDEDTVPSPATPETAFSSADRLLQETEINIGYRDELYRTARDVAIQANLPENIQEIDKWVVHLAARGETEKLVELLLEGYDHLIDVGDEEYNRVVDVATERNHMDTVAFLQSVGTFQCRPPVEITRYIGVVTPGFLALDWTANDREIGVITPERREMVHQAIRQGSLEQVTSMLTPEEGVGAGLLAVGKNLYGRCSLHVAVLCQNEDVVQFIANKFPETLRVGDNLERIALHYAMGVDKVETISNILIKAGAKRVLKDLVSPKLVARTLPPAYSGLLVLLDTALASCTQFLVIPPAYSGLLVLLDTGLASCTQFLVIPPKYSKGRQPTYYFMNKSDILRLQDDEESFRE